MIRRDRGPRRCEEVWGKSQVREGTGERSVNTKEGTCDTRGNAAREGNNFLIERTFYPS